MTQVLPYVPSFGDRLRENIIGASKGFQEGYEGAEKEALLTASSDPKKTEMERASATEKYIRKFGTPADILKLREQQDLKSALSQYDTATRGTPSSQETSPLAPIMKTAPKGPINGGAETQNILDEVPTDATLDQSAAPIAQPNEDEVNRAIAQISLKKPQLGTVLQKQQNQKLKNIQEQERQLGESYKMSQKYREKVIQGDQLYHRQNMLLDRLLEVSQDPSVNSKPAFVGLMQKFGIPTEVWGNPKEAEIEKLSGELTKELPASWRGRILATEFGVLLRTLPQLVNTPEGRQLIARNMKLLLEPARLEYLEMEKLKKEYQQAGKKLPYDFQDQIYGRMQPIMNTFHDEFVKGTDEAISLAERIKRGGTIGQREEEKSNKVLNEKLAKLRPVQPGEIRVMDNSGGIFYIPESAERAAFAANPHLKRIP